MFIIENLESTEKYREERKYHSGRIIGKFLVYILYSFKNTFVGSTCVYVSFFLKILHYHFWVLLGLI